MSIATKVVENITALGKAHDFLERNAHKVRKISRADEVTINMEIRLTSPEVLGQSERLWVSAPMVELLIHASRTLPPYKYYPSVLPWPHAVCFAEIPFMRITDAMLPELSGDMTALQWYSHPVSNSAVVMGYGRPAYADPQILSPLVITPLTDGDAWDMQLQQKPQQVSAAISTMPEEQNEQFVRIVCTLWLLLQQKIAVRRPGIVDRAVRRRLLRDRISDIPLYTVIELRRPLTQSGEEARGDPIEWTHRWIVDGHWRDQWHPSNSTHVPTWIAPYVKGPDDKPLVVKDRIHTWVR